MLNDPKWIGEVLQASNTGIWTIIIDKEKNEAGMFAGDVMLKLLGLLEHPEPEECYIYWNSRIEEKYRSHVEACVKRMIETGKFLEVQYRWKHPWWGNIFVRCGGRAERLEDGKIQIRGYHQNVNELELLKQENRLREAEIEEIKQQKKTYNELFDSVLCGIVTYKKENTKFVFKKVNKEALHIFKYGKETFDGQEEWDVSEFIVKEDIPAFLEVFHSLKNIGDKVSKELRILTSDKEKVWIIGNTELIIDADGEEVYQSVFFDNNDSKQKTALLEEITENIPGGVCLIDLDTFSVLYGNEGFYVMHGCTEAEMREKYQNSTMPFLRRVDKKRIDKIIEEALAASQRSIEYEMQIQRADEKKVWVLVKGTIVKSLGNLQLNCVLIDITDRKNMERELYLNERRLSIALEQTANVVYDFDIKTGRAILKNGNFGPMVPAGIVDNAAENLVTLGILHKEYQKDFEEMWHQVANGSEMASKELLVRYKQGGPYVWTKAVLRTIYTENGAPLRAVGIFEDISLQKTAELAFIKEEKYRQAMLAETLASAEINVTKNIVEKASGLWERKEVNKKLSYDEILEHMLEHEIFSEDREGYYQMVKRESFQSFYDKGQTEIQFEHRRLEANERVRWMKLTAHLLKESISGDLKALIYLKDIDNRKRNELTMKYQSERDSLTGLYNKGTAEKLTRSFLEKEVRENARHAFIIMDLDHFKTMNDTYGHQYGDEVLRDTAAILRETFRSDDIEGRLGGDEMAILMKNIPSRECVVEKLEMIRRKLIERSRKDINITVSIGVSFFWEHGSSYEELYRTADVALYQAKKQGRNRYVIYDSSMEE